MPLTNTERTKTLPHQDAARKDSERDGSRATPGEPSSPPRPSSSHTRAAQQPERTPQQERNRGRPGSNRHLSQHPPGPTFTRPGASLARRLCRDHRRGEGAPQGERLYMQKKASDLSEALQGGDYLLSRFRSTIGVIRFNFSVRNGKRWSPYALITLIS